MAPFTPTQLLELATRVRTRGSGVVVVKLGGSAMEDPACTRGTLDAVAALQTLGQKLILVHGGGKPIDRAMAEAGLTPVKIQGRRYTDDATLEIVVRVLGELNAEVEALLDEVGGIAEGFRDYEGYPLLGERLLLPGFDLAPLDLGRVGTVTSVDTDMLTESIRERNAVPIIPSFALDAGGDGWFNVNADSVAAAVAGAMQADAVVFLTDTPGVLRDVANPSSLIASMSRGDCERLIRDGVVAGGMIPKVEACWDVLDAGVPRAVILDGRDKHALLNEFLGLPAGTVIHG